MDAEEEIVRNSRRIFRNKIRNTLAESGNDDDASKLYTKTLFVLKRITTFGSSLPIELGGGYKWNLGVRRSGSSLTVVLFSDTYGNPRLDFYALLTSAIIHPLDPEITDCHDAFLYVSKGNSSCLINYADACEKGFLDAEGNVKVELQIQVIGENVFPPFLVLKFRRELFMAYSIDLNDICSTFFEKTIENLKSMVEDKIKWPRFCTFIKESGQVSKDQMFCEKQDVIKESLVKHFFVDGVVTSPLLMEILYNGYQSINGNNTTAKFVRIEENRFELVGDVPSLFKRVVALEYKPVYVEVDDDATVEDYESNLTKNKIEVNFTRSELIQTEKMSKKKGKEKAKAKKNDKCVEENKEQVNLNLAVNGWLQQNDESIAAVSEEDTSVPEKVRAKLNGSFLNALKNQECATTSVPYRVRAKLIDLFMNALKNHEVIAATLKEKINALIAEAQEEHVACELLKAATELYIDAQKKIADLYFKARVEIESLEIISVLNIPGYVIWTRRSDLVSKEGTRETIYYQASKNRKTL